MTLIKKSITVTDIQDEWIKAQISSGNYGNESEVFRDLIRERQAKTEVIDQIRAAIIEGDQSGISQRSGKSVVAAAKIKARDIKKRRGVSGGGL